jgi:chemotaxis protein methyltransferase CheR
MSDAPEARAALRIARIFEEECGIRLSAHTREMIVARLNPRLRSLGLGSLAEYAALLDGPRGSTDERQLLVDKLTTNETYFFREPAQFTFLRERLLGRGTPVARVWCAACATGEEPYSVAMLLLDLFPRESFTVAASDISEHALGRASEGIYPQARLEQLPEGYLRRFFLEGTGSYARHVRVAKEVRSRVRFFRHDLRGDGSALGQFDVVFLRNVLIYFDAEGKHGILERVVDRLAPGGILLLGLAEALPPRAPAMVRVSRSIYARS